MDISQFGAIAFGVVVGWICYRTLRRKDGTSALSDISSVIGAVGGGTVVGLFKTPILFGFYSTGLLIGFFLYLIVCLIMAREETVTWMGGE
jgi:uncharacterized membrane protein YeaQ/YmgE (transglycosylase-associated protein family)